MVQTICEVHRLGLVEYQSAWDLQNHFAAEIATGERLPTLLLLEHPHTYTFGRRGEAANLLWDETELARKGVSVHWVDRGGDVTYHGPGQLVGYPLLPLGLSSVQKVDYIGFIRKLERVIIAAVAELGVQARQVEGLTGVWVKGSDQSIAKLAAIGVKVDAQGISRHGFALNVDPDMAYWEGIIGCGLTYPEISLAQLLDPPPLMENVIAAVLQAFQQVFGYDIQSA
jgi:lipoate-protein ligase B